MTEQNNLTQLIALIKVYAETKKTARLLSHEKEHGETYQQALHQVQGIELAVKALGINEEYFQEVYKVYRKEQRELKKV